MPTDYNYDIKMVQPLMLSQPLSLLAIISGHLGLSSRPYVYSYIVNTSSRQPAIMQPPKAIATYTEVEWRRKSINGSIGGGYTTAEYLIVVGNYVLTTVPLG